MRSPGRPPTYKDRRTVAVSTENDLLKALKRKGLTPSDAFNYGIRAALSEDCFDPVKYKLKNVPKVMLSRAIHTVGMNPAAKDKQAQMINTKCGTNLTGEELFKLALGE